MDLNTLLERLQEYYLFLRKRWLRLFFGGLILGLLLGIRAFFSPTSYVATATFYPDTGGQASFGSIKDNPLAFILGGGTEGAEKEMMVGVLNSRRLTEDITGDSVIWHGKPRLIADILIESSPKSFSLVGWIIGLFQSDDGPPTLYQKVYNTAKDLRFRREVGIDEQGFISLTFSYTNPEITQLISEKFLEKINAYYQVERTEKARENVSFFISRADSVRQELDKLTAKMAYTLDNNQFNPRAREVIRQQELQIEMEMLSQMYVQLVISKEQAVSQLQKETPVIQVLDPPLPPYDKIKKSTVLNLLLGGILGGMLVAIYLARHMLKADLSELIHTTLLEPQPRREEEKEEL